MNISEVTRRDIIDNLIANWKIEGRLNIIEFLKKTWMVHNLVYAPWPNSSHTTLAAAIQQHMINNYDWEYDYLLYECLHILQCSDETFTAFLASCIHPSVRSDSQDVARLLAEFNTALAKDGYTLKESSRISGRPVYTAGRVQDKVHGRVKNLIFAANQAKPEIVLIDSINNDIKIVRNEEYCLIYDKTILERGLLWSDLIEWWGERADQAPPSQIQLERQLYDRLYSSLDSVPEKLLFRTYFEQFRQPLGAHLPALIPQVYLHYDPYTIRQLANEKRLVRQRMDFLILFSTHERIVLEVDGQQHYSENNTVRPDLYADMVAEDRRLRLAGYEIYRFGGYELFGNKGKTIITQFFQDLFKRHSIAMGEN